GIPSGGDGGEEGGGHRVRTHVVPEVRRAARRQDLGEERDGCGFDIHLHLTGSPRSVSFLPQATARRTCASDWRAEGGVARSFLSLTSQRRTPWLDRTTSTSLGRSLPRGTRTTWKASSSGSIRRLSGNQTPFRRRSQATKAHVSSSSSSDRVSR